MLKLNTSNNMYVLDDAQHATIIAALRFYQKNGLEHHVNLDIATNDNRVTALDYDGIDALVDQINCIGELPVAVFEMDGGAIHCVRTSLPMRVVLLDRDIEGADHENLVRIGDVLAYLHDYTINTAAVGGGEGIDPEYIQYVLEHVDNREVAA